jgi:hypothetical protein
MSGHDAEDSSASIDAEGMKPISPADKEDPAGEKYSGEKKDATANDAVADPNLVDWDGPNDPANPRNWSKKRKMLNTSLVSLSVLYSYVYLITPFLIYCLCMENAHGPVKVYHTNSGPNAGISQQPCSPRVLQN